MSKRKPVLGMLGATIILGLVAGTAGAVVLHVATNGTDSATCGAVAAPCRSISQAIANAVAKDRIVVGPGRYGDLNGNGILGEPGEETGGDGGLVFVSKPLTLESEEGAGATLLDASTVPGVIVVVVGIAGSGSTIGKPGKGFTLSGGFGGLTTDNAVPFVSELTVSGNIASDNHETGFGFAADLGGYTVTNNLALRNGTHGFGSCGGVGHTFKGNTAIGNGSSGFVANAVCRPDQHGGGHTYVNNVAIGNGQTGFAAGLGMAGFVYRGNSAIGNEGPGWSLADHASGTLTQNNIYGNHPAGNCGINTDGVVNAINNFWGAATGPGPDPADDVCLFSGGSVVSTPFSTKEFPISTTWK